MPTKKATKTTRAKRKAVTAKTRKQNAAKGKRAARKAGKMPEKDFNTLVAGLEKPDHVETIPFLKAASAAAQPGGGLNVAQILALIAQYGPLIELLVGLIKAASGGGAGTPGTLPTPPAPPVVPDEPSDEEEDGPPKPLPARTIAGVADARWFHFQEGDPGKVKPIDKPRFDAIVTGADPLNGDLKSRLVADITPLLSDGTKLLKGMAENALVDARYAVIFDGQRYEGDEIANSPVTLNNLDANFRLTPRFVMGPGISGRHTFAAEVNVNGTGWVRIKANRQDAADELRIG